MPSQKVLTLATVAMLLVGGVAGAAAVTTSSAQDSDQFEHIETTDNGEDDLKLPDDFRGKITVKFDYKRTGDKAKYKYKLKVSHKNGETEKYKITPTGNLSDQDLPFGDFLEGDGTLAFDVHEGNDTAFPVAKDAPGKYSVEYTATDGKVEFKATYTYDAGAANKDVPGFDFNDDTQDEDDFNPTKEDVVGQFKTSYKSTDDKTKLNFEYKAKKENVDELPFDIDLDDTSNADDGDLAVPVMPQVVGDYKVEYKTTEEKVDFKVSYKVKQHTVDSIPVDLNLDPDANDDT
ncbi:hypothetical protein [Halospeciosus flavus]|uniref:Uncharacterized protein n=1 Tax=Halospeciosus flavus TaxID=3032283 RepID=A0ABD5Z987_9EURY|nr:hypothetical protein [Halospeciosus flavus]